MSYIFILLFTSFCLLMDPLDQLRRWRGMDSHGGVGGGVGLKLLSMFVGHEVASLSIEL